MPFAGLENALETLEFTLPAGVVAEIEGLRVPECTLELIQLGTSYAAAAAQAGETLLGNPAIAAVLRNSEELFP